MNERPAGDCLNDRRLRRSRPVLHLMGLDHTKLTYFHKGRPERPTVNEGDVYRRIAQA